ncbi:hypothetical protein LTR04_003130, partial [Oleoguttula sp. CCFEE 6159]
PITNFSWRNFFSSINYLRVMHKICKNKAHRNLLLMNYKSDKLLKKSLEIPQPELRRYTLKLIKDQTPFCGRKWRQNNMSAITAVYLTIKPELRDDWLAGSDVETDIAEALPLEQALRALTHWHNVRRYPEMMGVEQGILNVEQDFFAKELEKMDLADPGGMEEEGSNDQAWEPPMNSTSMSADAVTDPLTLASGESKSARKKKAKAEAAAKQSEGPTSSSTPEPGAESSAQEAKSNGIDSAYESPYIKEVYKNIRSVNKKLSLMQKVDSKVAANPNSSLDDLVASREINNDQKTQALKKPALQASLAQLEDQISQYKKFDQEYQQRLNAEKELLHSSHKDGLDKLREAVEAEAEIEAQKESKEHLLMLSRFLRAAAARRQNEEDQSEEGKAFEGALLLVYGGDPSAVLAAEKIIEGADEPVPSVEGDLLTVKYSQIKELSLKCAPYATEEAWVADVAHAEPAAPQPEDNTAIDIGTDPTIANAGLTEQGDVQINGTAESAEISTAPEQSSIDLGAANAAAEDQWDQSAPGVEGSMTEPLKIIPRDPAEADNPHEPAAVNSTQSWADDAATEAQKTE